jgi:hypothetical protein
MPKLSKTPLSLKQVIALSGLSKITVLRAVSIGRGNRTSFGRARMPGLKSSREGWGMKLWFKPRDVDRWSAARAKFNYNGFKKKKKGVITRPNPNNAQATGARRNCK